MESVLAEEHGLSGAGAAAPDERVVGAVAVAVAIVAMAFGYVIGNDPGESGDTVGFIVVSAIAVALGAFMFLWVIPRARAAAGAGNRPARDGLITAIVGFVSLAAFWLSLPYVLGPAAVILGLIGQERAPSAGDAGKSKAAVIVGALTFVLAIGITIGDELG